MIVKDFFRKLRAQRGWTQEQMGEALGFKGLRAVKIGREVENAGTTWDKHFSIFRKLVTEIDCLALFDDPLSEQAVFWALIHEREGIGDDEEKKRHFWEKIHLRACEELERAQAKPIRDPEKTKPRGKKATPIRKQNNS